MWTLLNKLLLFIHSLQQDVNLNSSQLLVCAYHCVQLLYMIQHGTVLIIFPHILQTVIALMSTGEVGFLPECKLWLK